MRSLFNYKLPRFLFVLLFSLFFNLSDHSVWAQRTSSGPIATNLEVNGKQYPAYYTYLELTPEETNKAFWKYSRSFAHPEKKGEIYEIVVPSENDEEQETTLFGKAVAEGSTSKFYLALQLDENVAYTDSYKQQLKIMLVEFKVQTYMEKFQDQINKLTRESSKLSRLHLKAVKKGIMYEVENTQRLSEIQDIEKEISLLRQQQMNLVLSLKKVKN